jgi:hypothetical protein
MNDELEDIWKEVGLSRLMVCPVSSLVGLIRTTNIRMSGILAGI